jgi:hypothetical protein
MFMNYKSFCYFVAFHNLYPRFCTFRCMFTLFQAYRIFARFLPYTFKNWSGLHTCVWILCTSSNYIQISIVKSCNLACFVGCTEGSWNAGIGDFKSLGEEYRSFSYTLCSFLHTSVTSSLLGPHVLLNTLFSNTLSLHLSLNASDQVSHPYKTTGKIKVGQQTRRQQILHQTVASTPLLQYALTFFLNRISIC